MSLESQSPFTQVPYADDVASTPHNFGMGIAICVTGWILAVLFFGPNAMMSASGTRRAIFAANTGILACLLFAIGGCVGLFTSRWITLLPGAICQIAMFVIIGQ